MARYFRLPFANSGDKDPLPDETVNSLVSYATGYSQDYQRNPASDPLARRMERNFFNQLMFDVTDTLKALYETGTVPFITSTDNNGAAFGYAIGARVLRNNRIYENTTANNTRTPPASGWVLVDAAGLRTLFIEPGEFGLGGLVPEISNLDIPFSEAATQFNSYPVGAVGSPLSSLIGVVLTITRAVSGTTQRVQIAIDNGDNIYVRVFSNNINSGWKRLTAVGDFGLGDFAPFLSNLNIPESNRETRIDSYTGGDSNVPTLTSGTVFTTVRTNSPGAALAKTQLAITQQEDVFTRLLSSGTYTDWRRLLSTNDRYVTSTGSNANGGWRQWSDGYTEQQGIITKPSNSDTGFIVFPIPMPNVNWRGSFISDQSVASGNSPVLSMFNRTTTTSSVAFHGVGSGENPTAFDWRITGG